MKNTKTIFPFTAIVAQDMMKRALILNAVDPHIGGVLIRGERGTAKSTAARALAALLPKERVISGCRFGCDPEDILHRCDECEEKYGEDTDVPESLRVTPFVNLPVSATEDRVLGTLDIEAAISEGKKRFEPGVLAAANRGVLYVDEVNLLDDHVVDLLLDSAAMGVNRVEREGISFTHPARFILVGTMNPEEGDLRPQLLDRFAHCVEIRGISDAADRVEIMKRSIAFEQDPEAFSAEWQPCEEELSEKIDAARKLLPLVRYDIADMEAIAALTSSLKVEGHRADIVILRTAIAQAAFSGRTVITAGDIALAAELALPHRMQKGPFSESDISPEYLQSRIAVMVGEHRGSDGSPRDIRKDEIDPAEKKI